MVIWDGAWELQSQELLVQRWRALPERSSPPQKAPWLAWRQHMLIRLQLRRWWYLEP